MGALLEGGDHSRADRLDAAAETKARQQAAARRDHRQVHLGAVAGLQDGPELAQPVDQAHLEAALGGPEFTREQRRVGALQAGAAALAHPVLEAVVDLDLQARQALDVVGLLRAKRIEHRLALARGMDAALDAEAGDEILEAEARADHADRAHDRGGIGDDLVGGAGQPIAARGGDILDEGDHRQLLLGRQQADALGNQGRLHRRSAGRVDRQRHGLGAGQAEGARQQWRHCFDREPARTQDRAGGDHA